MPYYYIYKVTHGPSNIATNLQKVDRYEDYKTAKQTVRTLRSGQTTDAKQLYRIIFAESELQAEEMLMEKREAPVIMEWEK